MGIDQVSNLIHAFARIINELSSEICVKLGVSRKNAFVMHMHQRAKESSGEFALA